MFLMFFPQKENTLYCLSKNQAPKTFSARKTKILRLVSYFTFRITSKGQTKKNGTMEVILIDQNRSDSFLLKFFLDEISYITDIHEFGEYGEALAFLSERNEQSFQGEFIVLCTEDIRKKRGADFLAFIASEFSELTMYRVLTGEDSQSASLLLRSGKIDAYLEKKIELDDFGVETNRVVLEARKSLQAPELSYMPVDLKDLDKPDRSTQPSTIQPGFHLKNIIPTCVFRLFAPKA